jgi:hypothetical protein
MKWISCSLQGIRSLLPTVISQHITISCFSSTIQPFLHPSLTHFIFGGPHSALKMLHHQMFYFSSLLNGTVAVQKLHMYTHNKHQISVRDPELNYKIPAGNELRSGPFICYLILSIQNIRSTAKVSKIHSLQLLHNSLINWGPDSMLRDSLVTTRFGGQLREWWINSCG